MTSLSDEKAQDGEYRHEDPATDQALEWYIRIEASEGFDTADRDAFETWLAHSPANRLAYDNVRAMWNCPELTVATARLVPSSRRDDADAAPRHRRRRGGLFGLAIAASLLLATAIGPQVLDLMTTWSADYTTSAGETASIVLPDGSRVDLNSRTALSLDFAEGRRGVRLLEGEAWFEVAHDAERPFTVTSGYSTVHVTGTSFDVAREEDEDTVHLFSGRIFLTALDGGSAALQLVPGEAGRADKRRLEKMSSEDAERRLAWRDGWIVLTGTPLREALSELERHTSTRVMMMNSAIVDTPVSGSFRIGEADDAIRAVVTAAGGVTTRIPGGVIIIR